VLVNDPATVLDFDQLRDVTFGDPELMREVVAALIDDTSRQIGILEAAVYDRNSEECKRLAHYSKGACANLGANSSADLLKEIEREAAAGQFGACEAVLALLAREIEQLRGVLARI